MPFARNRSHLLIVLLFLLAGCGGASSPAAVEIPLLSQNTANPQDIVKTYLDNWKAGNYPAMYAALSPQSQTAYSQAVFQTAYSDAAEAINLSDLTYNIHESSLQGLSAAVTYDIILNSPDFGEIADDGRIMRLVQSPNGWGIAWSSMDIINGLTAGAKLDVQTRQEARGNIYDHNGNVLVEQGGTIYALYAAQQNMPNVSDCLDLLAHVLMRKRGDLATYFNNFNPESLFYLGEIDDLVDARYGQDIKTRCAAKYFPRTTRRYVGYGAAVHITGYIGYPPQDELDTWKKLGYSETDLVGRDGIEREYQTELAGQPEKVLRIISPQGVVLRELGGRAGSSPQSLTLTIDRDLQLAVASAMADAFTYAEPNWGSISPGAGAVVLDVHSGAVLAMVSFPFFDPGVFNATDTPALAQNPNLIVDLQNDPRNPFTNRVTQQQYFPGSTFKIITTAAASTAGVFTEPTFFCDLTWDGRAKYGDTSSPRFDWRKNEPPDSPVKNAAGDITMWQALAASCNPFFYEMGARLFQKDPNLLVNTARKLGMGQPTGLTELPAQEAAGSLPLPTAVEQGINEAIGQGGIQVTILQMARMVASIANGGQLYRPYLVQQVGGENGTAPTFQASPQMIGTNNLSDETMSIIRQGMCAVTTDNKIGTAWFDFEKINYTVCGKTGTAQSGRREPYGWFVAFAPADNPQIAIAVMVEYSREGSETAGPIVRRILDSYFKQSAAPYPKWWNNLEYIPLTIPDNSTGG